MRSNTKSQIFAEVNQEAAHALLRSTFNFLLRNQFSKKAILNMAQRCTTENQPSPNLKLYKKLVGAYDDMGVILSTWFSNPEFLNTAGQPVPLSLGNGSKSFGRLLRVSRARVDRTMALELMQQSPSVNVRSDGSIIALRRVFVLTNFIIPRAAFTIERYLDTVRKSSATNTTGTIALIERSSHVSRIDLAAIAPILRNIEGRGTAFMDSIDGEMEGQRYRKGKSRKVGELGVLVFAWTKNGKTKAKIKSKKQPL